MAIKKIGFNHYKISEIIKNHLITKTYLYYNKKESINLFKREFLK